MSEEEKKPSLFEQHAQTVIAMALLALLVWHGSSLLDVRDRLGRIEVHQMTANTHQLRNDQDLSNLSARVRELELTMQRLHSQPNGR